MESSPRPAETSRVDVNGVIGEVFDIYRENAVALIASAVVVFAVVGLVSGLLTDAGGFIAFLLASIVRMAGQALYTGFVVKLVEDVRDGRRDHSVGDLFSAATPVIAPLILMSILWGIGVGIGFVLLIVPGLFLLTIWSVTAPSIVIERVGVIESFSRSRELVRGEGWSVFGTLVVAWLITVVLSAILAAILGAIVGSGGYVVGLIIASAVTAPILSLAISVIFFRLGGGRPAAGPADEAAPPSPTPA